MGFVGFLIFAVKCSHLIAWPLFALGYPLWASIRAVESDSNFEMQKSISYWILFSLISLFELAFAKFIEWIPLWLNIKLIAICWLVIPQFNGAYDVYKRLVHLCLSVNLQEVINQLNKPRAELPFKTETFLAVAEKYVTENGTEALDKLIARKSKRAKPNDDVDETVATREKKEVTTTIEQSNGAKPNEDVEEINVVASTEKKEVATTIESKCKELNIAQKDMKAVEVTKKNAAGALEWCKEPNVTQKDTNVVELTEKNAAATSKWEKCGEANLAQTEKKMEVTVDFKEASVPTAANLAQTEKKMDVTVDFKEAAVPAAGGENAFPDISTSNKVQKEWTCALCQVTTQSETTLNSHLQGKRHWTKCEELKASTQKAKNKSSSSSTENRSHRASLVDRPNHNQAEKVQGSTQQHKQKKPTTVHYGMQQSSYWCGICNVNCPGKIDVLCHLNGKKHLSQVQDMMNFYGGV